MYPTPAASAYGSSQNGENGVNGEHARPTAGTPSLETWSKTWPTPTASSSRGNEMRGAERSDELLLLGQAKRLGIEGSETTAVAGIRDAGADGADPDPEDPELPTPTASEDHGSPGERFSGVTGAAVRSRLGPTTDEPGPTTSPDTLVLSPRFVEALMGWPDGWTDCARSGTESSPSRQSSPSTSLPGGS